MEKLLIFIPLFVMCLSCNNKKSGLTENAYFYKEARIMHDCSDCINVIRKNIEFYIKHEEAIDLSKYDIRISFNGKAYEGEYKYPILIKDLCWCLEPSLNISVITVSVIDSSKNRQYVYSQKNSFNLENKSKVYIKLLSDRKKEKGEFKIKFDNDLFYYPWLL